MLLPIISTLLVGALALPGGAQIGTIAPDQLSGFPDLRADSKL